jgi:LuxR family maltose regulon positive regulatory protein
MARKAPLVEGTTLLDQAGGGPPIALDTVAWQRWLEQAASFAFHGRAGRFTARRERRGRADGYWRAYRRHRGKLYSSYLGMSSELTLERLEAVAQTLADVAAAPAQSTNSQLSPAARTPDKQAPHTGTITVLLADSDPL